MVFVLSVIASAVFTSSYTCIVLYKRETLKVKVAQTVLRFAVTFVCYVTINFASVLAIGAIYGNDLVHDMFCHGKVAAARFPRTQPLIRTSIVVKC